MKVIKQILLGSAMALGIWISLYILSVNLLAPLRLGNYTDFLYVTVNVIGLAWLLLKKRWVASGSLAVFAICLAGPVLLFIVSVIGCAIGQCLII